MIFLNNLFGGVADIGGSTPIDYVNGTLSVTLPQTSFIHGDTFNTSGAVVTYTAPDGTQSDVTSAASFDPSNGSTLNVDGQNTVRVSYTPSGKDTVYATQLITVTPVPQSLTVIFHDTGIRVGEATSYKGAIVKALMSDRTEKDVSGETLVWSPLEGTVQNNSGSITVTCTYTENGVNATGSAEMVVTNKSLVRIALDLGQTQYYYNDRFDTTNTVVTATYDDDSTANVKSKCEFLPESRTTLTTHGNNTVVVTYTENAIKRTASGVINVKPIPQEVNITFADNGFRQHDILTYSNATVKVTWSDGTVTDETAAVDWDPEPNTELERTGSQTIKATFAAADRTITGQTKVNVTALNLTSIGADFTKKEYDEGDYLDLTGKKVTALYDTGATRDVTDYASWSPSEGSTLRKGTTGVTCSYTENGIKKVQVIPITVHYVDSGSGSGSSGGSSGGHSGSGSGDKESASGITITGMKTTWDAGDPIDYDGVTVTASMSGGENKDVTDSVSWNPSNGHKLSTTDTKVIATYRDPSGNTHKASVAITVNDIPKKLDVDLATTSYEVGDSFSTSGAQIVLTYASGRQETLSPGQVSWNPSNGTKLNKQGTQFITVTYTSGS